MYRTSAWRGATESHEQRRDAPDHHSIGPISLAGRAIRASIDMFFRSVHRRNQTRRRAPDLLSDRCGLRTARLQDSRPRGPVRPSNAIDTPRDSANSRRRPHVQYAPGAIMKHGLRGEAEQAVVQIAHRAVDRLIRPASQLHRSLDAASIGLAIEEESHARTGRHQRRAGPQTDSRVDALLGSSWFSRNLRQPRGVGRARGDQFAHDGSRLRTVKSIEQPLVVGEAEALIDDSRLHRPVDFREVYELRNGPRRLHPEFGRRRGQRSRSSQRHVRSNTSLKRSIAISQRTRSQCDAIDRRIDVMASRVSTLK